MGLFDKKFCDLCGQRIRFLGNRKLEDGNLCKDCESKLSPWFSDRRRSTVQEIRQQLSDREANREKVAAFHADRTLGEDTLLLIDDAKKQFILRRAGETMNDNPDVLSLSEVTGCEIEVDHSKLEEKTKDAEGKPLSYDPPRHKHSYRFFITVHVNHRWFDEMRFRVNRSAVEIKTGYPREDGPAVGAQMMGALLGVSVAAPISLNPDTEHSEEYQKYSALADRMRAALLGEDAPEKKAAPAPAEKVACPCCSAVSVPDASGRCPYCGEKLK